MSYPPPTCAQASDTFDFSSFSFSSGGIALPASSEHEPLTELSNLALPDSSKPSKGSTVPTPSSASISMPPPTLLPSQTRTQPAGASATAPTLLTTHATVSAPSSAFDWQPPTIAGSFASQGPAAASTTPLVAPAAGVAKGKNAPRKARGTKGPPPQASAPAPAPAASSSAPPASQKRRRDREDDSGPQKQRRSKFRLRNPEIVSRLAVFKGPPQPPAAPLPTPAAPLPTPAAPLPPCYQALLTRPPTLPPRDQQASQTMTTYRPTRNQRAPTAPPVASTAPPVIPAQVHVPYSRRLLAFNGDFSVPSDAPPVPKKGCEVWMPGTMMLMGPDNEPMDDELRKKYSFCGWLLEGYELEQARQFEGSKFWGNEVFDPETRKRCVVRISRLCAIQRNPNVPLPPPSTQSQQLAATGNVMQSAFMPPATTQYTVAAASALADGNAAMFTPSFYVPPPAAQYSAATYPPANGAAAQSAYMHPPTAQYSAAANTLYAPADGEQVAEFMSPLFMGLSAPSYQGYASTSAMTLGNYDPAAGEVRTNPSAFTEMSPLFMASSAPPHQGYASTSTMAPAVDYNYNSASAESAASYALMADTSMGYLVASSSQLPADTTTVSYPSAADKDFEFDFTFDASKYVNYDAFA
ncbi:hypothetical protein C8R47DRAFT_455243 [Mycena vitilis]|nr:hypothetical protein C8R47DRAFT_455243 [Mycena vitilis]